MDSILIDAYKRRLTELGAIRECPWCRRVRGVVETNERYRAEREGVKTVTTVFRCKNCGLKWGELTEIMEGK